MVFSKIIDTLNKRVQRINFGADIKDAKSVTYLMSRDQRINFNHALLAAQAHSRKLSLPLVVVMAIYPGSESRSVEALDFMLGGLRELKNELSKKNVPVIFKVGTKLEVTSWVEKELLPAALYIDFSPLRGAKRFKESLKGGVRCPVYEVDTHNIVPVWQASDKLEYAARTIRPKIHKKLSEFMAYPQELELQKLDKQWLKEVLHIDNLELIRQKLDYKASGIKHNFEPGEGSGRTTLAHFIKNRLAGYAENRNDPTKDALSNLSPYLHFGQISSLEVALKVLEETANRPELQVDADALIEELVVRKELSDNWCYYSEDYDRLEGAPEWAKKTLIKHKDDPRDHIYSFEEFRDAKTHDSAWNASQIQLRKTGKIHGYMRMYWAKKVLEWTPEPQKAIDYLIKLNDFYSLDGGDPNGYAGIMWSVAGVHDRPWQERRIYGTVRSMVYSGLKKKFDVELYIRKYSEL
jgi:deoxyribodipyrimidine photo-lyase